MSRDEQYEYALQKLIEAVRALDDEIYACTAPLSITHETERYTRRIHNALVDYDKARCIRALQ